MLRRVQSTVRNAAAQRNLVTCSGAEFWVRTRIVAPHMNHRVLLPQIVTDLCLHLLVQFTSGRACMCSGLRNKLLQHPQRDGAQHDDSNDLHALFSKVRRCDAARTMPRTRCSATSIESLFSEIYDAGRKRVQVRALTLRLTRRSGSVASVHAPHIPAPSR